jgi:hypothetical protein
VSVGVLPLICVSERRGQRGLIEVMVDFGVGWVDAFFQNVCELDLVFSFYKVRLFFLLIFLESY